MAVLYDLPGFAHGCVQFDIAEAEQIQLSLGGQISSSWTRTKNSIINNFNLFFEFQKISQKKKLTLKKIQILF